MGTKERKWKKPLVTAICGIAVSAAAVYKGSVDYQAQSWRMFVTAKTEAVPGGLTTPSKVEPLPDVESTRFGESSSESSVSGRLDEATTTSSEQLAALKRRWKTSQGLLDKLLAALDCRDSSYFRIQTLKATVSAWDHDDVSGFGKWTWQDSAALSSEEWMENPMKCRSVIFSTTTSDSLLPEFDKNHRAYASLHPEDCVVRILTAGGPRITRIATRNSNHFNRYVGGIIIATLVGNGGMVYRPNLDEAAEQWRSRQIRVITQSATWIGVPRLMLQEVPWIFYVDLDVLFTNKEMTVEGLAQKVVAGIDLPSVFYPGELDGRQQAANGSSAIIGSADPTKLHWIVSPDRCLTDTRLINSGVQLFRPSRSMAQVFSAILIGGGSSDQIWLDIYLSALFGVDKSSKTGTAGMMKKKTLTAEQWLGSATHDRWLTSGRTIPRKSFPASDPTESFEAILRIFEEIDLIFAEQAAGAAWAHAATGSEQIAPTWEPDIIVAIVSSRWMNSQSPKSHCESGSWHMPSLKGCEYYPTWFCWQPNDFILHFPGSSAKHFPPGLLAEDFITLTPAQIYDV